MNFAIVGCGFISKKHVAAIDNISEAKLVAVCDRVEESMKPFIESHQVDAYIELNEMLKDTTIDVVAICVPSGFHKDVALQVAAAKKHIIIEKPIAMSIEDADEITKAANKNGVKLIVVHPNRYRPVVMELKKLLDNNKFGKISHANCLVNWNRGQEYYDQAPWRGTKEHDGGVLMNQAIHNLDLLLWFIGTPKEVISMEATRLRDIEAEDVSCGIVRFEDGILANIQASTTVYPKNYEESITIFGEKGTVKIGGPNALYFEKIEYSGMDESLQREINKRIENDPWGMPGHQQIYLNIIDSIKNDKETAITGEEATNALKLVTKMYQSASSKSIVKWDE
ncbi:Gfo/Idh/MocA family oxidoreductase [Macrococcoides bohemicum]|uniref:Gfo/Idh/MocA family protein n=1 Tax=Macrococcoides bohemicum TaxID=1903056 RepID=UPI001C5D99E6|nr:Gfo/Idh/MocA family oxidoreductase [Macrococcus bohemicus]QYA44589.1 Gfo/Idh/MocA family oxidoreductase [Macrococcus bohemicus]